MNNSLPRKKCDKALAVKQRLWKQETKRGGAARTQGAEKKNTIKWSLVFTGVTLLQDEPNDRKCSLEWDKVHHLTMARHPVLDSFWRWKDSDTYIVVLTRKSIANINIIVKMESVRNCSTQAYVLAAYSFTNS